MTGTSRLASLVVTAALLAGCGGNGDDPRGSTGMAATPDDTTAGATAPETSDEPTWLDGVEPASGRMVDTSVFTLRLPKGFRPATGAFVIDHMYSHENRSLVHTAVVPGSTPMTLDEVVAFVLRNDSTKPTPKRVADIEVDGRTLAHLRGRDRVHRERVDMFVIDIGGSTVKLLFTVAEESVDREALWKSTLATLEWK